jgi:hypothetical protein
LIIISASPDCLSFEGVGGAFEIPSPLIVLVVVLGVLVLVVIGVVVGVVVLVIGGVVV